MRTIRGVIVTILATPAALAATPAALAATPAGPHQARPPAAPAPAQLATVSFTSPRRGYGLFTAQHGGRCTAAVGATSDGGRHFTRPGFVTSWPCAQTAPAAALTGGDRRDVILSDPALFASQDGGRTWTVHRPCRPIGACPPLGLGYLGPIAAPSGRSVFLGGARSSLLVTGDGGRAWRQVRPLIGDSGGGTGTITFFGPASRPSRPSRPGPADRAGQADRTGLVFGYDARHGERLAIWHTSDGGAHWQVVYPQAP